MGPDRSKIGSRLAEFRPMARAHRLTVRRSAGGVLMVELWQEVQGSRGFYYEVEQLDRWAADDCAPAALTMDTLMDNMAEAVLQRRLPGLD